MTRRRLPNRRFSESFDFIAQGMKFTATFSRDADGEVREVKHRASVRRAVRRAAEIFDAERRRHRTRAFGVRARQNRGAGPMTAQIISFPKREQFTIRVIRDDEIWLVLTHRGHGWLYADKANAIRDATEVANGFGFPVRVIA